MLLHYLAQATQKINEYENLVCLNLNMASETVTFNLRGKTFTIDKSSVKKQNSKISALSLLSTDETAVTVNRNPKLFHYILDYFSTGQMHYPKNICAEMLKDELSFWGLEEDVLASCCWHRFKSEIENRHTLKVVSEAWKGNNEPQPQHIGTSYHNRLSVFINQPNSSKGAKVWSRLMLVLICLSIILFMVESLIPVKVFLQEEYQAEYRNLTENRLIFLNKNTRPHHVFSVLEIIITIILTTDFILKFVIAPNKLKFWIKIYNIIDFFGILPIWVLIIMVFIRLNTNVEDNESFKTAFVIMNIFRCLRICRLVHFMRHYRTLLLIYLSLKSSAKELLLLMILMIITATMFANLMYFAEIENDNFMSIPHCLWWAFVTMTTVGYGDMYPKGVYGYIIGVICSMMGILVIALPLPVIASNFSTFYDAARMLNREEKHLESKTRGIEKVTRYTGMEHGNKVAPNILNNAQQHENKVAPNNLNNAQQHENKVAPNNLKNAQQHENKVAPYNLNNAQKQDYKVAPNNLDIKPIISEANIITHNNNTTGNLNVETDQRNYSNSYESGSTLGYPNNVYSNGTEVSYSINV